MPLLEKRRAMAKNAFVMRAKVSFFFSNFSQTFNISDCCYIFLVFSLDLSVKPPKRKKACDDNLDLIQPESGQVCCIVPWVF